MNPVSLAHCSFPQSIPRLQPSASSAQSAVSYVFPILSNVIILKHHIPVLVLVRKGLESEENKADDPAPFSSYDTIDSRGKHKQI